MRGVFTRVRLVVVGFILSLALASVAAAKDAAFDVRDYGARPDGKTLGTESIQQAVDACAAAGGGTVLLAGGKFLTGTIYLKSHVTLKIDAGAVLLGSTALRDYPRNVPAVRSYTDNYVNQSLIAGEDLENAAIVGRGTIDGQGAEFKWDREHPYVDRPYGIRLVNCRDVLIEGVHLQNSAMWMQHYLACEQVTLRGITVWNHSNHNNDGVDIDGCKDVTIAQCVFDSDDDAITMKSTLDRATENVAISDCVARSFCNPIKMGTESNGGFVNIAISNCVVTSPGHPRTFGGSGRGLAGIALELVDGGRLDGITISNITIKGVSVPIFMRLANRARPFKEGMPAPGMGTLKNVMVNNIVATDVSPLGCSITGLPEHPVENVSLNNIQLAFEGGGEADRAAKEVPELPQQYPESGMFGQLPAYGFYCRHVKGLKLGNVTLRTAKPDLRHALVCDDVEELAIEGLDAVYAPGAAAILHLIQTRGALIRGCRPRASGGTFLKLEGDGSRDVVLLGNDLSQVGKIAETAPDVRPDALSQSANLVAGGR